MRFLTKLLHVFGLTLVVVIGTALSILAAKSVERDVDYYSGIIFAKMGTDFYLDQDYSLAASSFKDACSYGVGESCAALGGLYFTGQGVPQDYALSAKYFSRACDLWFCNLYQHDVGSRKVISQIKVSNQKECLSGKANACLFLGSIYSQSQSVSNGLKKLCDLGHTNGCLLVSIRQGVRQSNTTAKLYYDNACSLGDPNGCIASNHLNHWWNLNSWWRRLLTFLYLSPS